MKNANPVELFKLNIAEFTKAIGRLYAEVDYTHPFRDGNSWTLRQFMRELAGASGYSIEGNQILPDLLRDAIRPSRAFEIQMPGNTKEQGRALLAVREHVQATLDLGETKDFCPSASERGKCVLSHVWERSLERRARRS
ncbi:MAG: Fic family protein [Pseudomonadales bacterium]|nr:Fic family protein [Pseudomonadales bacterium]